MPLAWVGIGSEPGRSRVRGADGLSSGGLHRVIRACSCEDPMPGAKTTTGGVMPVVIGVDRRPAVALALLMGLAAAPAQAQSAVDPNVVRSSLEEVLSLVSFGAIKVQDQGADVVPSGGGYEVKLPLTGFSAPPNAAIIAVARPAGNGLLDVTSMIFPSAGAIETAAINGVTNLVSYTIGRQTIVGKIDPTLAVRSSYQADLGQVRMVSDRGEPHGEQTVDHVAVNGTFSGDPGGRLTFASQGSGTGFHFIGRGADGLTTDATVRALAGHFSVEGFDRVQGNRLMAAARGLAPSAQAAMEASGAEPGERPSGGAGGRPGDQSGRGAAGAGPGAASGAASGAGPGAVPGSGPGAKKSGRAGGDVAAGAKARPDGAASDGTGFRQSLRAMVEAANGLLNRIEAEETIEDIRFAMNAGGAGGGGPTEGAIGRVRFDIGGDTADQRLNGRLGVTLEGISTTAVAAGNAAFIPHHVDFKTVLAGVDIPKLMALLRAVTEPDADLDQVQEQAMALLADPKARFGIEALAFNSGPLQVSGSARAVSRPDGQLGAEIHIAASGIDGLLAQAQTRPDLQQVMPMVMMAKGMGRPQGDTLVWDVSLGDGPPKVNGVAFGQPRPRRR